MSPGFEPEQFRPRRSWSAELTLDAVVAAISRHDGVRAVVAIGSTASGPHRSSDVDLLLVVDGGPTLGVEFSFIDGRPADLLITNPEVIGRIADRRGSGDATVADIRRWLRSGSVLFARSDLTARAVAAAQREPADLADEAERHHRWVELNVNLLKIRRYASASRPDYERALDLLLDAAFAAAPRDATVLAGHPWQGERAAAELLAANAPGIWELIGQARCQATDDRLATYEALAVLLAEPAGGIWPPQHSTITWRLDLDHKPWWSMLGASNEGRQLDDQPPS